MARDLVNISLAPSTKRVYASGQRRYWEFCRVNRLPPFPLPEDQLCTYVAHLVDEGLQYSSVKSYLSANRRLQIVQGMRDPFISSWPLLEYALCGVKLHQARSRDTRAKKHLLMGKTSNELCPVAAISAYLVVRGRTSGPFFHFNLGSPLSREMFVKHVRRALSAQGVDASSYSGHSFCTGAATAAAAADLEDSLIKTLGRWQSAA